jgi:hypothetical protein
MTDEEIKLIQNNDSYVWYEIPEMNIKFKVTPDTKEDLKYFMENESSLYFYNQSTVDFIGKRCGSEEKIEISCTNGALGKISVEKNSETARSTGISACRPDSVIAEISDNLICFTGAQSPEIPNKEAHEKYLDLMKNKELGIYLDTASEL